MKEKINYRNHIISIERDECGGGEREYDHPNSYGNGEWKHGPREECSNPSDCWQWISVWLSDYSSDLNAGFDSPEEFREYFNEDEWLVLPVRGYSHSGWAFSLSSSGQFGCQWDSGFAGLVAIRKELPSGLKEQGDARYYAENTVKHFEAWFNGEYYGYSVEGPVSDDSCWGYLAIDDDLSYMISDAKSNIDASIAYARKQAFAQLKTWIKNRVPLNIRQREYDCMSPWRGL